MGREEPASTGHASGTFPFLVAHRAGNRLADLEAAERLGVRLVEADVRLYRGRLEVRHLKTIGPLPVFWDRWRLAAPWHRRLQVHELLAATGPGTELVLDLKGASMRLPALVRNAIEPHLGRRRFTLCARSWDILEPFEGLAVRRVYSVGSPRQLRRLLERFQGHRVDGVSIHERLIDAASIASLKAIADVVMTWPVNHPERAIELLRLGVDGLITDDSTRISGLEALGAAS